MHCVRRLEVHDVKLVSELSETSSETAPRQYYLDEHGKILA